MLHVVNVKRKRGGNERDPRSYFGVAFPSARYKRSRSAGSYAATRRRRSSGYRNPRTGGYLGVEKKFLDLAVPSTALTAPTDASGGEVDPATANCLSAPAIGDDQTSRDGRKIIGKYLHIRGQVSQPSQANAAAELAPSRVFVACVLDTQTNGAQLNSEDVFVNPAANAGLAAAPLRNIQFAERFKVLKSDEFLLEPKVSTYDGTNIETAGAACMFDWYIPLKNLKITFTSGTTGVVANVMDNSIHMIAYTHSTGGVPVISYNSRFRFIG